VAMPVLEDMLLRFRRGWTPPGPVMGQAGVPEDLEARVDDELRDLSAHLASIDEEGQALIRAADAEAGSILAAARAQARQVIEAAQSQLAGVRALGAADRIEDRQAAMERLMAGAEREAADLRVRARSRLARTVQAALAEAFADPMEDGHARVVGGG
jgi:hypothetical protein